MNTTHFRGRHVHLMGIGGAGVSALVPLLEEAGADVSGCDLTRGGRVHDFEARGIAVDLGHDPSHVAEADVVVHTSAVPDQHAELRAARAAGVEVLTRPACLAALMQGMKTAAVAGSHGKTSTTWMLGHLCTTGGLDPVVMVGGTVASLGGGGRVGSGELFVAEVDESDGGFAHTCPDLAIIANLEAEHLRHYGSFSALCDAFRGWLRRMGPDGTVIVPSQGLDPRVLDGFPGRVVRVGIEDGDVSAADLDLQAEGADLTVCVDGAATGRLRVPLPGRHMVSNALMAWAAARELGVDLPNGEALAECERVGRRFTVHGRPADVRVVEDYAHHPTEIRATIAAARLGSGRVHVLYQPHRYSRTADCFQDYLGAFDAATAVAILPVYAAGEDPIAGAGGRDLAESVAQQRATQGIDSSLTQFVTQGLVAVGFICAHARPGDTILVLGAGDVGQLVRPLLEALDP